MKRPLIGEKDRRMVPRWRGFLASQDSVIFRTDTRTLSDSFLRNEADWRNDPTLWNALDFIAGAIVEDRLDKATKAIEQVRKDARLPAASKEFILRAENGAVESSPQNTISIEKESALQISASRKRLAYHHWDAIEWMDLARGFTSLGQIDKASRCVLAAVKLAPTNRFIVRAATRFYVHTNNPDRALRILSLANFSRDPWLMAPQIAISSFTGRPSLFAKDGLRMLKQDFSAADLSELGAALGTLEVENGKIVHAKKLLRQSLHGANENSVAQIDWLNRTRLGDTIETSSANPPKLYEAGAWGAFVAGDWMQAARLSGLWFRDQPFSGNAATVHSYVLSDMLEDHEGAKQILATALRCNPKHPVLLNNLAFVYINLNLLQEAEMILNALPTQENTINTATAEATRGLLNFRKGNMELGRAIFLSVIDNLASAGDRDQAGRAATSLAFEEVRARTPNSLEAVQRSLNMTRDVSAKNVLFRVEKLKAAVEKYVASERSR